MERSLKFLSLTGLLFSVRCCCQRNQDLAVPTRTKSPHPAAPSSSMAKRPGAYHRWRNAVVFSSLRLWVMPKWSTSHPK